MKNLFFYTVLSLVVGLSFPSYAQNNNILNINGVLLEDDDSGVANVSIQFVITTGQDSNGVFTAATDPQGFFEFLIPLTNLTSQGCGILTFTDCNGNVVSHTLCWHPENLVLNVTLIYCEGAVDPDCSVEIIDAATGTFPSILLAEPEGQAPFTYQWSDGSPTSFILILNPGTYCVTMTDATACVAEDCYTTTIGDSCAVDIQLSNIGLTAYATGPEPVWYSWSTGDTTQSIQYLEDGEYCVTVIDANQCVAVDCIDTTDPQCSVSLLCDPVENGIELWALGQGAGSFEYEWNTGDSSLYILVEEAGEYCVTITDALGCVADTCVYLDLNWTQDSCFVFISILDDPATDFYTLTAMSNAGADGTYEWSTGETGISIDVYHPGTYCVTATTAEGCVVSNCIIIETSGGDCWVEIDHLSVSSNANGVLYAITDTNYQYEYLWSDGSTESSLVVPGPGEYCVIVTNVATGCIADACYYVDDPQDCWVGIDHVYTDATTYGVLIAHTSNDSMYHFEWLDGTQGAFFQVPGPGEYCVVATNLLTGCVSTACYYVEDIFDCWVEIEVSNVSTSAAHILLKAVIEPGRAAEFAWSNGITGQSIEVPNEPGTYCVTAYFSDGCVAETCFTIGGNCWVDIVAHNTNPAQDFITLEAVTNSNIAVEFVWSDGLTGPVRNVIQAYGTYCVTAYFPNGCTAEACYTVPGACLNLANIDFGDCEAVLGIGWDGQQCTTISGCSTIGPNGINYQAYFFDSFDICWDHCGANTDCKAVADIDFGPCDAILGVGWNGVECVYISGCSPIGSDSVDYSEYIFPNFEICLQHCEDDCVDISGVDFGLCQAIIGVGWNGQECVTLSGCSTVGSDGVDYGPYLFDSYEACVEHCGDETNCSNVDDPLEQLPWIQEILNEADSLLGPDFLCECNYQLNQYCYNEIPIYVLEPAPNNFCADVFSYYYKESGELICITGGLPGYVCDELDPNIELKFQRHIWSCSDCVCPAIYDPVCGSDGNTYENSCFAECAGVEWTPGECNTNGCDSLASGTAVIPVWLSHWIEDLEETQHGCQGIQSISAVYIDGIFGFFVDDWNATDGEDFILDCEGEYYCSAGGGFSNPTCGDFEILYPVWECQGLDCAVFIQCDPTPNGAELFAVATGHEPIHYQWSTGDTGEWSFASETGTYCVTITDATGCVAEACLFVDLGDVMDPCFSYIQVKVIDQGQVAVLTAKNNSPGPYTFQWNTGEVSQSIEVKENGLYCVEIITANGCASTACIEIILADPNHCSVEIIENPTSVFVELKAIVQGTPPFSFEWNTGDTTQAIIPEASGVYCVFVWDANGCRSDYCYVYDEDPNDDLVQIFGPLLMPNVDISSELEAHVVLFQIKETDELIAVDTTNTYSFQGSLPNYLFIDKEPGRYLTKAFVTKPEGRYVPTYHLSAPFWNTAEIIEAYDLFNDALIEMIPVNDHDGNGVISGQVFAGDNFQAEEGTPEKSSGEGLANVELILFNQWDEILDYQFSDANGEFRFGRLDYGTYKIYVEIPGIEQAMEIVTLTPDTPTHSNLGFEVNADGATTSTIDEISNLAGINLFPNPVLDMLSLRLEMKESSDVKIQIMDASSKLVWQQETQLNSGINMQQINTADFSAGVYFIQIQDDLGMHSERFVKL